MSSWGYSEEGERAHNLTLGRRGNLCQGERRKKTDCKGYASAGEWIEIRCRRQEGKLTGGLGAQAGR